MSASTKSKESSPNLLLNLRSKANQKPTNDTTDITVVKIIYQINEYQTRSYSNFSLGTKN